MNLITTAQSISLNCIYQYYYYIIKFCRDWLMQFGNK